MPKLLCPCSYAHKSVYKTIIPGGRINKDCNQCRCKLGHLDCETNTCSTTSAWSPWSGWSVCSGQACRLGDQWRTRLCLGSAPCDGSKSQTRQCRTECPHEWSAWSPCTVTCGIGYRKRERAWSECMAKGNCPVERIRCRGTRLTCPGAWKPWSAWTKCPADCNDESKQYRTRHCFGEECDQRTQSEGRNCTCMGSEGGNVSTWSQWTSCSRSCGIGVKQRHRTCSSQFCAEPLSEHVTCYSPVCGGDSYDDNNTIDNGGVDVNFTCPAGMERSECLSPCTIKTCDDLSSPVPLHLCSAGCVPGCICPLNTVEQGDKCVPIGSCHCKDETGRYWPPGSSWRVEGESCSSCQCHQGQVACATIDCFGDDGRNPESCHYSQWSSWTVCNATCSDDSSSRFRFREPKPYKSGCTTTMDISGCDELPKCSTVCKGSFV